MYWPILQVLLILGAVTAARYEHQCSCQEQDLSGNFCYLWTCKQDYTTNDGACFQTDQNITKVKAQSTEYINNNSIIQYQISIFDRLIKLGQLKEGDIIINYDHQSGQFFNDQIIGFLDRQSVKQEFMLVQLQKDDQISELEITDHHLVYVSRNQENQFVRVFELEIGDQMLVNGQLYKITNLSRSIKQGMIAPLTQSGTILVNGVLSSCFAHVKYHDLTQLGFWPFRMFYKMKDLARLLRVVEPELYENQYLDRYVRYLKKINSFVFRGYFY